MSLRLRLLLAVGAVAMIALVAADVVTYQALHSFLYRRVDQSLEAAHLPLERAGEAIEGSGPAGSPAVVTPGTYVEIRDASGAVLAAVGGEPHNDQLITPRLPAEVNGFRTPSGPGEPVTYFTVGAASGATRFRVRASLLRGGGVLLVAQPLTDTVSTLHRLEAIELIVTFGALLAAAGLGWWLVRVGLQPLADVERTAEAIAEGELDQRVPGASDRTEVGRLAGTLNTMLGRIQDAFAARDATEAELRRSEERMRRFVADASHELRTPLAAVAAYAELFERGASERPEDLARVMSGIRSETGRMGHLVEDLLLLARLDEGRPLERKPVELVALTAQAADTARAVGPAWPVQLAADRPVEVVGDGPRLRQVVDNLLANVRAHTPPGTSVRVRVGTDGADAVIEVADNGPGLTEEHAARVFERFYRADTSRSRRQGGTGLGLGIVAAIVGAHGGRVSASATPGGGATFTIRLPLVGPPDDAVPAQAAGTA